MRVQVPHDAQKAGGLQVAGFSYPCPTSSLFSSVDRSPARSAAAAAAPPDLRLPPLPRQISGRRRCPARPAACHSPARSATAPRASLGASARSPARPRRPRIGLRSGGSWRAFPLPSQALAPHATQNSPSTRTTPVSQPYFTSGRSDGLECTAKHTGIACTRRPHPREHSIQSSARNKHARRQQCVY